MGKRTVILTAFILWSAVVLSAFYISQRPLAFQVADGALAAIWSVALTLWLLFDAAGLGYFIFKRLQLQPIADETIVLAAGLGLGVLGLAGYALGASGLASAQVLFPVLSALTIGVFVAGLHRDIYNDLRALIRSIQESKSDIPKWIPPAVFIAAALGFLHAFLPPAESFDALLYHLRLPELLIADGRILPYNNFPLWFPSLIEGDYIWALSLRSERAAQMIHWSYAALSLALAWTWSRRAFGNESAWWSLALLVSMPSLPLLSSWAYADFGLIFFSLACNLVIWRWSETREVNLLLLGGVFAGFAMGVKYTSFILPVFCVSLIAFYEKGFAQKLFRVLCFSVPALIVASPWYLRNWIVMGNPFYPFVFGGRYWDEFLTAWYNHAGSGVGWDLRELLLIPLTITQGYRDVVYYDGRMGPLFLLFAPFVIWILWKERASPRFKALLLPALFFAANFALWTFGVVQTRGLWQSRLLWSGLFHLAIPMGDALANIGGLNVPRIRISFLARALTGLVIAASLLDASLFLLVRRPFIYALGLESRAEYFRRIQPEYSEALDLVNDTPENSKIYLLFEPRSYNMTRDVQPDPINANLAHDHFLYGSADKVIEGWKRRGYTHILIHLPGAEFVQNEGRVSQREIEEITSRLNLVRESKFYTLYSIP